MSLTAYLSAARHSITSDRLCFRGWLLNLLKRSRQLRTERDTRVYLQALDDQSLQEFGYSPAAIREIRAGKLLPPA